MFYLKCYNHRLILNMVAFEKIGILQYSANVILVDTFEDN